MQRARRGWVVIGILGAVAATTLSACEPGSTGSPKTAPSGPRPAVKVGSEPMSADEVAAAGGGGGAAGGAPAPGGAAEARAVLQPAVDTPGFSGTVTFTQEAGQLHVVASLAGVTPPGSHGFHIHESGVCERDPAGKSFATAGGHFNPGGSPHGCPEAASHHAGDLGNVTIQPDGTGRLDITTSLMSLSGPTSVLGKAVILHAGTDDCTGQPAGNAGSRFACGVVEAAGGSRP
jgi:Cu-Zn family superoxide dismutase